MDPLRILVVDDSAQFRAALCRMLARDPAVSVVGQAASTAEALELVPRLQPDLLLVDAVMPDVSGLELTRALKAAPPAPRVIVLTMHSLAGYRDAALAAGADDFIEKDQVAAMLTPAIRRLLPELQRHPYTPLGGAAPGPARDEGGPR